jgi:AcrR family transcriptional regulator
MMKHETRRKQLIDTALAQIASGGWAATSHRTIASTCGIHESSVYQHFPKRAALRQALMSLDPSLQLPEEPDQRMRPKDRKRHLLEHGLLLAVRDGYKNVTMGALTEAAGVSRTLYQRYFHNVSQFRVDVMRAAVKQGNLAVIAQGLVANDPHALKAPIELRQRAAATLA